MLRAKILFLVFLNAVSAINLDNDGGYHITISFQENSATPSNVDDYVTNLENYVEKFSSRLYDATDGIHFIKSASILIPLNWDFEEFEVSSRQNFAQSDIKISEDHVIPEVTNPTKCGHPGTDIRLPLVFFEDTSDVIYKKKDKALLHLWAQFRWGVFEESGFPGNTRFPYFRLSDDESEWTLSTCTNNVQLSGNQTCPITDINNPPNSGCRFIPDEVQENIHSSLMIHFYWLDGIDSFCEEGSHDSKLSNRQNVFCDHRSILDVYKSTLDYRIVTQPTENYVPPTFSVVKSSDKPLIYFLIDSRTLKIPEDDALSIRQSLSKFVSPSSGIDVSSITSITRFPGASDDENSFFEEVVVWKSFEDSVVDLQRIINEISAESDDESTIGVFGLAIKYIVDSIKIRSHSNGGHIFVFKSQTGNDIGSSAFEQDVMSSLLSQKTKLHAVEIRNSLLDPGESFLQLSNFSGGIHYCITNSDDASTRKLGTIIDNIISETKKPFIEPNDNRNTVFNGLVGNDTAIKLHLDGLQSLRISLTTIVSSQINDVELYIGSRALEIFEESEWREPFAQGRRMTYSLIYETSTEVQDEILKVSFVCEYGSLDCTGVLVIIGEKTTDKVNEDNVMSITVSSSAIDKIFNGVSESLLFIYAKIEKDGEPLMNFNENGNLNAFAEMCSLKIPTLCSRTPLFDNGAGIPDLLINDGIFSGAFVPTRDDIFKVKIHISFEFLGGRIMETEESRKPRSIDQNIFPCSLAPGLKDCIGTTVKESVQISADLMYEITVVGTGGPPEKTPQKILDLRAESTGMSILLSWTAPIVFTENGIEKVENYELRYCFEYEAIKDNFDTCTPIEVSDNLDPGETQKVELIADDSIMYYFSIRSSYNDQWSLLSNILSHRPLYPMTGETTPQTSETTEDSTVESSTTEDSTVESSTTEDSTMESSTTEDSTVESSTTEDSTVSSTTEDSTVESSTTEDSTVETPTTDSSVDTSTTADTTVETSTIMVTNSTEETEDTMSTSQTLKTTTIATTETPEYFFKKPEGYITIAAVGLVGILALGGGVGFMCWKRRQFQTAAEFANKTV